MSKDARRNTTKAHPDHVLIQLAQRMSALRLQEIEMGSHAARCDDALVAADARVDEIADEMDNVYEQMLALTPATPEGHRALALAIAQRCAVTNQISMPESEFERGVAVLLSALGADQRAA